MLGFVVTNEMMSLKRLWKYVSSNLARSCATRCSMPASRLRDRSGIKSGLPRKYGERLKDSSIVGSLMPVPALALIAVSPTEPAA